DVDDCVVAGLQLALGVLELTEAACEFFELLFNVFVGDSKRWDGDGDLGAGWTFDLWANLTLSCELNGVVVCNLRDMDVWRTDDLQVVFGDSLLVAGRQHVVNDLLQHCAATEACVDQLARCFTLTETRNLYLLRNRRVSLVDFLVELSKRNVDG